MYIHRYNHDQTIIPTNSYLFALWLINQIDNSISD